MRTQEEINRQIEGINNSDKYNSSKKEFMIDVLKGERKPNSNWQYINVELVLMGEEAFDWLTEKSEKDLF